MAFTISGGISITLITDPPNYGLIVAIPGLITLAGGIQLGFPIAGLPGGTPSLPGLPSFPSLPGGGLGSLPILGPLLGGGLPQLPPTGGGISLLDLGGTHITLPLSR